MPFSRRDFLKFSALLTASSLLKPGLKLEPSRVSTDSDAKNVLVIVFDAFSANNINFYGYPRQTMPNLTRLLDRATVYHNHYASANFTTPGTASLLTGRHAWEHLALNLTDTVQNGLGTQNIFSFFDDYYKTAYTHNYFADILLAQFGSAISHHEFFKTQYLEYKLTNSFQWFDELLRNDPDTAQLFKTRLGDTSLDGYLYALLFPSLIGSPPLEIPAELAAQFPDGFPVSQKRDAYILEDSIDWTMDQVSTIPQPFLGYFHYLPPHGPHNNRIDFKGAFGGDGYTHLDKQNHPAVMPNRWRPYQEESFVREGYDEFILYVDSEFNRLFNYLDQQGILDNTILVFTSDHGEMFERRVIGHMIPFLYEPVIKVPLVIFEPGQTERRDIYSLTSAVDIIPTLLRYTGHDIPPGLPGKILPPFDGARLDDNRTIFSFYARNNPSLSHLPISNLSIRRGNYKVIQSIGYSSSNQNIRRAKEYGITLSEIDPFYEVYDIAEDPEELNNLASDPALEIQVLIGEAEQMYHDQIEYPQILEEDS